MAFSINRSQISIEHANIIRSMLCLTPDIKQNKYNRNNNNIQPILFYNIDDDLVHLPYLFAASLFQITPNINLPFPSTPFRFTGTLRPSQIDVEAEAFSQLEKYGTSTLGLYPGFGKTILGAKLSSRCNLITCILVHREILTTQWKKTYEDVTDARVWIVGEKIPPRVCDVIICMDTRWHLIPKLVRDSIGFLIIDEAHAFCTPSHVPCLLSFHPKYILLESGSLERDDNMHSMMYAIAGNHGVFRDSTLPFNVIKVNTNVKPERKQNRQGGVDWCSLVYNTLMNPTRNDIILHLVRQNINRKILILTSSVEHSLHLHSLINDLQIAIDFLCGTKRGYIDSTVLVGTISKIGTGFDPANSCPTYAGRPFDLLILACSIKKYSMLIQNIGRIFRCEYPTVFHLVDNDDIYKSHWYICRKWYLARGATITEYTIPKSLHNSSITAQDNPIPISNKQSSWIQLKINNIPSESTNTNSSLQLNIVK